MKFNSCVILSKFPVCNILYIQSMKSGFVTLRVHSGDGTLPRGVTLNRSSSSGVVSSSGPSSSSSQSSHADRDRDRDRGGGEEEAAVAVSERFEVTLVKEAGRPLGLQLIDVKRKEEEGPLIPLQSSCTAVAIRNIAPNSPAKRSGNLRSVSVIIMIVRVYYY